MNGFYIRDAKPIPGTMNQVAWEVLFTPNGEDTQPVYRSIGTSKRDALRRLLLVVPPQHVGTVLDRLRAS